jgi:methylthioribulose-1-phosphate dehydratase
MDLPLPTAQAVVHAGEQLAALGRWMAGHRMVPATSGNLSLRLGPAHAVITASGIDKGALTPADALLVDGSGRPLDPARKPSAETRLHVLLYARRPDAGCILHAHSHNQTVASRRCGHRGAVVLRGYELVKAFPGFTTHETALTVPVVPNSQDMEQLAARVDAVLRPDTWGFLVEGHGLYTWGATAADAQRHLEALDFLLGCELSLGSPP